MTVVQNTLADQLSRDFARACAELSQAMMQLHSRDDMRNRSAVARRRAEADAVLDMYLEVARPAGPGSTRASEQYA
jgi:hypothetical protein